MKGLFIKTLTFTLLFLSLFIVLSYITDVIPYFNISQLFSGKANFFSRLLILLPFSFAASLLIIFIFYYKSAETPTGIFVSLFCFLIIILVIFDVIMPKERAKKDLFQDIRSSRDIITQTRENKDAYYRQVRIKINKILDIIYFTGDFENAFKKINEIEKINNEHLTLVKQLKLAIKKTIKKEENLYKIAKKNDPDFLRGYKHLKKNNFYRAERYFRSNIIPSTRYFHKKALALLRRQGQINLEKKYQNLRRKKQLVSLGAKLEKNYRNDYNMLYNYYHDLYKIMGNMGLTNAYSRYAKLISVDEITENELEIIKTRKKKTNIVYITDVLIQDKKTERKIKIKNSIIIINRAYFIEDSETVYFSHMKIINDNNDIFIIKIARLNRNKGILKSLVFKNKEIIKDGIITLSNNANDIVKFKSIYPIGKKLSTFKLLQIKKGSLLKKLFYPLIKERINYYMGFIFTFIIIFIIGSLIRENKSNKIKKLLWIFPILIILFFSFFLVHLSYFISTFFVNLIL